MDFNFGQLLGWIGLFLLGMSIITDGIKAVSWPMLVNFLEKATNNKFKAFFAGFLSTAILQSSSTTTMLTIGFVNAGILAFANSLWLIFGANVWSTASTWIIALIGMKYKVSAFALPMIGLWIILKILSKKKIWLIGWILTGFGLLFIGIEYLQAVFNWIEKIIPFAEFTGKWILSILIFLLAGFVLTILMQSSAAVIAIILSVAININLPFQETASAIIGASIGTTATALFVSIGATANAKRTAWVHILFNIITGSFILILLPGFLFLVDYIASLVNTTNITEKATYFHTLYKLTGVILMIPLSGYLAGFLSRRFSKNEVQIEQPKYLDSTLYSVPSLALEALAKELERQRDLLVTTARGFVTFALGKWSILPTINKINQLDSHISKYESELSKQEMSEEDANKLAELLEIHHQYRKSQEYLKDVMEQNKEWIKTHKETEDNMQFFLNIADELLEYIETPEWSKPKSLSKKKLDDFYEKYQIFKKELVEETIEKHLSIEEMERLTQLARTVKTMIFSLAKAQKITISK